MILVARELLMLVLTRLGAEARGGARRSTGRALGGLADDGLHLPRDGVGDLGRRDALLYVGLAMTLWATALYVRDGWR